MGLRHESDPSGIRPSTTFTTQVFCQKTCSARRNGTDRRRACGSLATHAPRQSLQPSLVMTVLSVQAMGRE